MFLKMYTGLSFLELMEQLNANVHVRIFCDIVIDPTHPLTNYKVLDDIVAELSTKLKIQRQQVLPAGMWKPYMKELDTMFTDATCYESEMRYPTDPKPVWESTEKAHLTYAKQRRHSKSWTHRILRRELKLPGKILKEIGKNECEHDGADVLTDKERNLPDIITKVYRRQKNHFRSGDARESIPDRIVSENKLYVRPIVRGKEEGYGNPVHLLRYPCCQRYAVGRRLVLRGRKHAYNRGPCTKYAHERAKSWLCARKMRQNIRKWRVGRGTRQGWLTAQLKLKTLNDSP